MSRRLPIGIQTFKVLCERGYIYVDKTVTRTGYLFRWHCAAISFRCGQRAPDALTAVSRNVNDIAPLIFILKDLELR